VAKALCCVQGLCTALHSGPVHCAAFRACALRLGLRAFIRIRNKMLDLTRSVLPMRVVVARPASFTNTQHEEKDAFPQQHKRIHLERRVGKLYVDMRKMSWTILWLTFNYESNWRNRTGVLSDSVHNLNKYTYTIRFSSHFQFDQTEITEHLSSFATRKRNPHLQ